MRENFKWFVISFPTFILGCSIIYFVAIHRAEFDTDVATGIFFTGAGLVATSLTVWNIKSNEVLEVQKNG